MVAMLILQMGIAPDYVLDKMKFYEAKALIDNAHYAMRDAWERARLVAYVTAQTQSTKSISPDDIIKFPWEQEQQENDGTPTPEQIQALKEQANEYALRNFKNSEKRNR